MISTPRPRSSSQLCAASSVVKKRWPPVRPLVSRSRTCSVVSGSIMGGPGLLQQDLAVGLAGHVDGEEAHEAEVDVTGDLETELADVEVERLVLVEHVDLRDAEASGAWGGVSLSVWVDDPSLPGAPRRRLLRNCSAVPRPSRSRWAPPTAAGGRALRAPTPARYSRRGLADHLAEGAAERPQAGEADVEADVGHAAIGPAEQVHGALHPAPLQVPVRGLTEGGRGRSG